MQCNCTSVRDCGKGTPLPDLGLFYRRETDFLCITEYQKLGTVVQVEIESSQVVEGPNRIYSTRYIYQSLPNHVLGRVRTAM